MKICTTTLITFVLLVLSGCSSVFYQPTKKHYLDPRKEFKIEYQGVTFDSIDGTKLHGWFIPSRKKEVKGTVVQFHGNAQNISTHIFSLVWMIEQGYNIFSFDYRGYGKSKGKPEQRGVYLDSLAALKVGKEFHEKNGGGKFIVYGQSLGGNIALRAVPDFEKKKEIDLLVLDSTFASYQDIAFYKTSHSWLLFLVSPLSYLVVSDEFAAEKFMGEVETPTLVIVGQKDFVIPQQFGKKIYKQLTMKQKWLWKLPEGGHIDAFHIQNGMYRTQFLELVDSIPQM